MRALYMALFGLVSGAAGLASANPLEVSKDRGRYSDTITFTDNSNARGYREIELQFQWWRLFDQFVYYHKLKWERAERGIPFQDENGETRYLSDNGLIDLSKYPDLLQRLDAVRPVDIDISLSVTFRPTRDIIDPAVPLEMHCYPGGRNASFDISLHKSVHLAFAPAGEWGDNLTPASPQRWTDMLVPTSGDCASADDSDARMTRTFDLSETVFITASVSKIEWPQYALFGIYEDYLEREAGEKEAEAEPEEESEEPGTEEDFWSGEDVEAIGSEDDDAWQEASATEDDFWSGDTSGKNDFWSGEGTQEEEIEVEAAVAAATGNQYLGDVETDGSFVRVEYRDHGQVDGDRISLLLNGMTHTPNIRLRGSRQSTRIDLDPGVNRLSFEALNQGSAGSNTAEFSVYSEGGDVLFSNTWNIHTGYQATILVLRGE